MMRLAPLFAAWLLVAPTAHAANDASARLSPSEARARGDTQVSVIAALIETGLHERALQVLAEVRGSQNGSDPRLDVLQARALHATGMSSEAQMMLEAHTKRMPRDASGWSALGVVLADAGDLPRSVQALERARRLTPEDPVVLNNLGYAQMASNATEEAIRHFRASLAVDPSQPRTRNNLGFALARLERDMEALQAFRAANTESDARYNLGVACVNRGDRPAALAQFNAALEAAPGHPAAAAALDGLLSEASP